MEKKGQYTAIALVGTILFLAILAVLSVFLVYVLTSPAKDNPAKQQAIVDTGYLLDISKLNKILDDKQGSVIYWKVLNGNIEANNIEDINKLDSNPVLSTIVLKDMSKIILNTKPSCANLLQEFYDNSPSGSHKIELISGKNSCVGTQSLNSIMLPDGLITLRLTRNN